MIGKFLLERKEFEGIEEEDVEFIRLQFTDIFGNLKNVAVTSSQLERALNNECMFDGSSIEGFAKAEESDLYLHPDPDTFAIFPCGRSRGKWQGLSAIFIMRMARRLRAPAVFTAPCRKEATANGL